MVDSKAFFKRLPIYKRFVDLANPTIYQDFPSDWSVALVDIVDSTKAIADGNYKAVNMAGASLLSAMRNTLKADPLPTIFGGDGAAVALPDEETEAAKGVLLSCQHWVEEALQLKMRVALVPVRAIHEAGQSIRVARFAPSDHVDYAMFDGGGLAWAEDAMKKGLFPVSSSAPIEPPKPGGSFMSLAPNRSQERLYPFRHHSSSKTA